MADANKTGEVRTTSSTGGEKGVKPEAFALIPWDAMDEVARVYNAGAEKYSAHNWRKGYEWSKSFSAACRHLFAFWRGEDRDPELGTLHLAMAVFHLLGLISFSVDRERYGRFDDRYAGETRQENPGALVLQKVGYGTTNVLIIGSDDGVPVYQSVDLGVALTALEWEDAGWTPKT